MPLIGLKCEYDGKNYRFSECLKCGKCAPPFLLNAIIEASTREHYEEGIYSVTQTLGCLRESYLKKRYEYYAPLQSLFYMWRGTLIHKILEAPNLENCICEETYQKEISGCKLRGRIDFYNGNNKILYDLKTIGDNGLDTIKTTGAKEDHIKQTNLYRFLLDKPVDRIVIAYISMMEFAETGKENQVKKFLKTEPRDLDYCKTGKVSKTGAEEYIITVKTPEVPIIPDKKILSFVRPKLLALDRAFKKLKPPSKCDGKTRAWKCKKYCNVNHLCEGR